MSHKSMSSLVTDVQKALYQGAGPSVQTYSQDIIMSQVQNAFDHMLGGAGEDIWWPQFVVREFKVLDGTTGFATTPYTKIKSFDDVKYVYPENGRTPLPTLPLETDLFRLQAEVGGRPRYIDPVADANLFQVWPNTAVGNILVVGRLSYAPFALNQVVPFDDTALVHYAAWSYFTDDASNPAAADKHQGLFESRLSDLKSSAFGNVVSLNGSGPLIPDRWEEC